MGENGVGWQTLLQILWNLTSLLVKRSRCVLGVSQQPKATMHIII